MNLAIISTTPSRRLFSPTRARAHGITGGRVGNVAMATAPFAFYGTLIGMLGLGAYLLYKDHVWWGLAALLGAPVAAIVVGGGLFLAGFGSEAAKQKEGGLTALHTDKNGVSWRIVQGASGALHPSTDGYGGKYQDTTGYTSLSAAEWAIDAYAASHDPKTGSLLPEAIK